MDTSARYRSIDCLSMIEQRQPALTGASRNVAEAILRDPWAILGMTIYDVAEAAGVSLPSVTRFCRAVGYPGFRELVQGIAQSLGRSEARDLEMLDVAGGSESEIETLARTVVRRQIEALQTTVKTLDYAALGRTVDAIAAARRVTVIGHGGAYVPALGMSVKLNWAGVAAAPAPPDLFSNQVIAVDSDDVVIGLSHQGRTRDTINMLKLAGQFGAKTVGVTAVPRSPLGAVCDISLAVLTPEVARAGTFLIALDSLMVVADLLAAAVAERKWGGAPPNRGPMVEWIETNLRIGPLPIARAEEPAKPANGRRTSTAPAAMGTDEP